MRRTACVLTTILMWSSTAWSFCRTETCDETTQDCGLDASGCPSGGIPIFWTTRCLSYGIQEDGSNLDDITATQTRALMDDAFAAWTDADCDGDVVQLGTGTVGQVECAEPEFNCGNGDANYNTIMFRDGGWPYDPDALAITTVSVDMRSGEILDADMELNSTDFSFSLPDETPTADLLSVLTHEAGHMLGLAHSDDPNATMFAFYNPRSLDIRQLDPDDEAGICEVFGSGNAAPECSFDAASGDTGCLGGTECEVMQTSGSCSLTLSEGRTTDTGVLPPLLGLLGLGFVGRRRRPRANRW